MAQIAHQIKGESSFWINKTYILSKHFNGKMIILQFLVSESQLDRVVFRIKNQDIHHATKSFADEVNEFNIKYGFRLVKD